MLIYTHLFSAKNGARIHSIPCDSLKTALDVASGQKHTINIVAASEHLTVGYQHGVQIFHTASKTELSDWLNNFGLREPCSESDKHPKKSGKK